MRHFALILLLLFFSAATVTGGNAGSFNPSARDKCPVCGMFVAKYPDWTATALFSDGSRTFFDGVKDMFKFLFDAKRYQPSRSASEIGSLHVTDYYSLTPVDARNAHYVIGSDVYGPMGKELIPFAKRSDAEEFLKDHKGKSIVGFKEVTRQMVKELDR